MMEKFQKQTWLSKRETNWFIYNMTYESKKNVIFPNGILLISGYVYCVNHIYLPEHFCITYRIYSKFRYPGLQVKKKFKNRTIPSIVIPCWKTVPTLMDHPLYSAGQTQGDHMNSYEFIKPSYEFIWNQIITMKFYENF